MISRCTGAKILIGMIGFFGHDYTINMIGRVLAT
jgi:nitrogen fixation protein FixH